MLKNGPKMAPKRVPKWAPEGRPRLPKGHIGALHGPGRSCAKPFFVVGFGFALVCVFGFGFVFLCVLLFLFVHSFVLYVFMCACFWLCVLFPVVVFLFYAFVFAMFEDCLTDSRGHLKETCNMFQDVSEWFSGDADSFGMRWVCASRDGSFIGGLES